MEIRFKVDPQRVTLNQLIALEEAKTVKQMRDTIASFVVDDNGEPVESEEAKKAVGSLTLSQLESTTTRLVEAMKLSNQSALPTPTGGA